MNMSRFMSLAHDVEQEMLCLIAKCEGLQRPVRRAEKNFLTKCIKIVNKIFDNVPLKKVRVQSQWQKSYVLLQAATG